MRKVQDQVQDRAGNALVGASVDVYLTGTTTHATIYSDDGVTPATNPLTTDANGAFLFYVDLGTYDLRITGSGITTRTVSGILVGELEQDLKYAGIYIVDGILYTTIQAAITAASTSGAVLIPPNYAGSDTFTNPNNIPIKDLRGSRSGVFATFGSTADRGYINILDFGADPTGNTKNGNTVFTDAIAALPAGGGMIFVPANCQITLADNTGFTTGTKPVRIVGTGVTSLISGTGASLITLAASTGCSLENLKITDSNASGSSNTIAVDLVGSAEVADWRISNCVIQSKQNVNPSDNLGIAVRCQFALKGIIQACLIQGWNNGLKLMNVGAGLSNANLISGSAIRACAKSVNITSTGADGVFLFGNIFEGSTVGVELAGGDCYLIGNHLENDGLSTANCDNVVCSGLGRLHSSNNLYSGCETNGAIVKLTGNTVNTYSTNDFFSTGCTNADAANGTLYVRDAVGSFAAAGVGKFIQFAGADVTGTNTPPTAVVSGITQQINSLKVGTTGVSLSKIASYAATLSPALVGANTTAEQTFTVTGVAVGDIVIAVNKPTAQAGLGIVGARVSGANTVGITFSNNTGGSITPTASESYKFAVLQ